VPADPGRKHAALDRPDDLCGQPVEPHVRRAVAGGPVAVELGLPGTSDLIRGDIYFWGSLMAGALLASIPIVIVYVLFLDYYVSGLTAGAVKG
jgi:hypothetical protein